MRSRTVATVAAGVLLSAGLVAPPAAAAPSSLTGAPAAAAMMPRAVAAKATDVTSKKRKHKRIERRITQLVNKERTKAGLGKVERRAKIVRVARSWSVTQARQGNLAHNPTYAQDIPSGWSRASENVAWTTAKGSAKKLAKRIVKAWMRSPGHRANILDPHVTKTGVGVARSSRHGWYFTQNFSN